MAGFQYYWVSGLFAFCIGFFLYIRQFDISEASFSPLNNVMLGIVGISTISLFWSPSKTMGTLIRRLVLILLVLMQLKNQLDSIGKKVLIQPKRGGFVALVTGGNGAIGRNVAASLIEMDIKVILSCQDVSKCQGTADRLAKKFPSKASFLSISKTSLDLSDLSSVKSFSDRFLEENDRLDYLIHAAGSLASGGEKSKQELEKSFATLFLGPFALSQWLMPLLLTPIAGNPFGTNAARIVSVVSHATFDGQFHPSILQPDIKGDFENEVHDNCGKMGDLDFFSSLWCIMGKKPLGSAKENGYARAMLSTLLGTQELQRRVDQFHVMPGHNTTYRRLVTSAVNPGVVSSTLSTMHTILGPVIRQPVTAAALVVHALQSDDFQPSSYIDSAFNHQDLGEYSSLSLPTHVAAFPKLQDMQLGFLSPSNAQVYSASMIKFKAMNFLLKSGEAATATIEHHAIAARIYDIAVQLIRDFQQDRPFYSTKLETSSSKFEFLK